MKNLQVNFFRLSFAIILIVSYGFSCVKVSSEIESIYLGKKNATASQFDTLTINAINLSEDMSRLSTKNDEVFLFIYDYSDTSELSTPLVSKKLIFDESHRIQSLGIQKIKKRILFFIEEDSFRNSEQIEPIVRIYFKEIMKADGYQELKKYLGDDDLLGFQILESDTKEFNFAGMSSLDKFEYQFKLN